MMDNSSNEEETRLRRRSFLYVVRYDISHIREDLEMLLTLNEEYFKSGYRRRAWDVLRNHSKDALRKADERRNYIRRNLSEIRDLTHRDPSLEPESYALTVVDGSREVFDLASGIEDPESMQPERDQMVKDASKEIETLDSEIDRLNKEIMKN